MDKKYIAEKRNKSKKYKNKKYGKKEEKENEKEIEEISEPEEELENNWARYKITEQSDHFACGEDYSTLLQAPISTDSYFKFKSEQNWDEDIKSFTDINKYFTIDLKLLNEGISCIPFVKRHEYDESIFSQYQLMNMKSTSEVNLQKYNKKFKSKNEDIIIKKNADVIKPTKTQNETKKIEPVKVKTEKNNNIQHVEQNKEKESTVDDNVEELLNLKITDQNATCEETEIKAEDPLLEKTEINKVNAPQIKVDLEQWLDDILDD